MMHSHSLAANAPRLLLAEMKRSKGQPELHSEGVPKPKAEPKTAPKGPKAKNKPKATAVKPGDQ